MIQYSAPVSSSSTHNMKNKTETQSIVLNHGEVTGGLAVLTGESSLYTIRAKYFSKIAYLTKDAIYK